MNLNVFTYETPSDNTYSCKHTKTYFPDVYTHSLIYTYEKYTLRNTLLMSLLPHTHTQSFTHTFMQPHAQKKTLMFLHICTLKYFPDILHTPHSIIHTHSSKHTRTRKQRHSHTDLKAFTCTCARPHIHSCKHTRTQTNLHFHIDTHT